MPTLPDTAGAIIIWNDIAPAGRDEFYAWHLHEHIPERVGVPGFLRGSRYIATTRETTPEFLTLYETTGADVATSAPYLARLNSPTAWTKSATSHFRNTSRALTRTLASYGSGLGGVVGTLRFAGSAEGIAASRAVLAQAAALEALTQRPRISRVRLCLTDLEASGERTAESRDRTDILAAPSGALLVEGCDEAAVRAVLADAQAMVRSADAASAGLYRLEHQLF